MMTKSNLVLTLLLSMSALTFITIFLMYFIHFAVVKNERWSKVRNTSLSSEYFAVFMIMLEPVILSNCLPLIALSWNCFSYPSAADPESFNSCIRSSKMIDVTLSSIVGILLFTSIVLLFVTTGNKNIFQRCTKNINKWNILFLILQKILISFVFLSHKERTYPVTGEFINMLWCLVYLVINYRLKERKGYLNELAEIMILVLLLNTCFAAVIAELSKQNYASLPMEIVILLLIIFEFYIFYQFKITTRQIVVIDTVNHQNIRSVLHNTKRLIRLCEVGSFEEKFFLYNALINTLGKWENTSESTIDKSLILPTIFYKEPVGKIKNSILKRFLEIAIYKYLLLVIEKCENLPHYDSNHFYFLQIYFLCYKIKDFKTGLWVLIKSIKHQNVNNSIFNSFEKAKIISILEEHAKGKNEHMSKNFNMASIASFIIFEFNRIKFITHLKLALEQFKLCFKELLNTCPNMTIIKKHFELFIKQKHIASQIFNEMAESEILPKALFKLYSSFVYSVAYNKAKFLSVKQMSACSFESKVSSVLNFDPLNHQITINKEQFFFIVSAQPESFGNIKYISQDVSKILSQNTESLINSQFDHLKPKFIQEDFKTYCKFLNNDNLFQAFEKIPAFIDFYIDYTGSVITTATKISLFRNLSKGINLFVLSSPLRLEFNNDEGCLLIDTKTSLVLGFTKKFKRLFNLSPDVNWKSLISKDSKITIDSFFSNLKGEKYAELLMGSTVETKYEKGAENNVKATMKNLPEFNLAHKHKEKTGYLIKVNPPLNESSSFYIKTGNEVNDNIKESAESFQISAKIIKSFQLDNTNVGIVRFRKSTLQEKLPSINNYPIVKPQNNEITDAMAKSLADDLINKKPIFKFNQRKISVKRKASTFIFFFQLIIKIAFTIYYITCYTSEINNLNNNLQEKDIISAKMIMMSKTLFYMQFIVYLDAMEIVSVDNLELRKNAVQNIKELTKRIQTNEVNFNQVINAIYLDSNSDFSNIFSKSESLSDSKKNSYYFTTANQNMTTDSIITIDLHDFTFDFITYANRFEESSDQNIIQKNKEILDQYIFKLERRFYLNNRGLTPEINNFFSNLMVIKVIESILFATCILTFVIINAMIMIELKMTFFYFNWFSKRDLSFFMKNLLKFEEKLEHGLKSVALDAQILSLIENGGNDKSEINIEEYRTSLLSQDLSNNDEYRDQSQRLSSTVGSKIEIPKSFNEEEKNTFFKPKSDISKRYQNSLKQSLVSKSKFLLAFTIAITLAGGLHFSKIMMLQTVNGQLESYRSHEDLLFNIAYSYHQIEYLSIFSPIDTNCETCASQLENVFLNIFQQYKNIKVILDVTDTYGLSEYYREFSKLNNGFCNNDLSLENPSFDLKIFCEDYPILKEGFESVFFSVLEKYRNLVRQSSTVLDACELLSHNPTGDLITNVIQTLEKILKDGIIVGIKRCYNIVWAYQIGIDLVIFIVWGVCIVMFYRRVSKDIDINQSVCNILTNSNLPSGEMITEELKNRKLLIENDEVLF